MENSNAKIFPKGCICIALYGATVGKLGVLGMRASTNQAICGVFPEKGVNNKYIFYALMNERSKLIEMAQGGAQPNISNGVIKNTELWLAPENEQTRIVKAIESLQQRSAKARQLLTEVEPLIENLRQSILQAAFSGKLTEDWRAKNSDVEPAEKLLERIRKERREKWEATELEKYQAKGKKPPKNWASKYKPSRLVDDSKLPKLPNSWSWVSIEELLANQKHAIKAGPFGSSLKKDCYVSDGYKIYGQEQVIAGDPYLGDYFIDGEKYKSLSSCAVSPGDLLISLVGTIGRTLVLPADIEPGIINPRLIKVSLNNEISYPPFLQYFIRSPFIVEIFSRISHGGTMKILNMGILKKLAFPLPPVSEQVEIVEVIEQLNNSTMFCERICKDSLTTIKNLDQSILAKAFRGELVPQDPNDEPASELLARIRATREAEAAAKKKKTKKKTTKKKTARKKKRA